MSRLFHKRFLKRKLRIDIAMLREYSLWGQDIILDRVFQQRKRDRNLPLADQRTRMGYILFQKSFDTTLEGRVSINESFELFAIIVNLNLIILF